MYNSAIGAKIDEHVMGTRGVNTFRVHGEMYHSIGTLLPNDEKHLQFAQIYIIRVSQFFNCWRPSTS
ncbi:hypothetical protein MELLADRAFT_28736 [Rhizophagus clarus]|uniref:Uncharacterized protein n=1 Tax=Rhizophagus clarus TaxID=94130 RepID=A0A8H3QMM1_9GLOM|nr:hypothetical protein MELLADRAFT_28736 [Rhizophagus clarus]